MNLRYLLKILEFNTKSGNIEPKNGGKRSGRAEPKIWNNLIKI